MEKDKQNKVEEIVPTTANTQEIKSLIYFVRGQQVMLDSDLAMLYQVWRIDQRCRQKMFWHLSLARS